MTYLILAATDTAPTQFGIEPWVWWGLALAVPVTLIMVGLSWIFASAWDWAVGAWLDEGFKFPRPTLYFYLYMRYGFAPSLIFTGLLAHHHPWWAVSLGLIALGLTWLDSQHTKRRHRP